MMASPFIVFFDTFTHSGNIQENTDCVRFKSGVQILELRILPFGLVVESNLSDEAIIGATNPATFDLSLYSNSRTNCIVLQDIAKHYFDEKNGMNCISFKEPVHSNFLLFCGRYSTLTVAVFGIPVLPLEQTLPHGTSISFPPPQIGITVPAASTDMSTASTVFHSPAASSFIQTALISSADTQSTWTPERPEPIEPEKDYLQQQSADPSIQQTNGVSPLQTGLVSADTTDDVNEPPADGGGLYEDGEIQDIDYEEISSNEDLFSDTDDADIPEDVRQSQDQYMEEDPRLARCHWRFDPWSMAHKDTTGSAFERLRIPDPTLTPFQLHCWLLERTERVDSLPSETKQSSETMLESCETVDTQEPDQPTRLPPPPDDWTLTESSAQYLLSIAQKFTSDLSAPLHEDWVEAIEGLESHLAPGLAFLYHTDKHALQGVTEALILWVYIGLDLSAALRQPNSAYIVRHLLAGIKLAGLVTGTLCPQIAWSLLHPDVSSLPRHAVQFEGLQVQHLLLNLIESPVITSTLRLAICRALDQTTRLPLGLDSFLGRHVAALSSSSDDAPIEELTPTIQDEDVKKDATAPTDGIGDIPAEEFKVDQLNTSMLCAPQDSDKNIATDQATASPTEAVPDEAMQPASRTPYQRLVVLFAESKNARVTAAYQRLLNKIHAYELLLEFHELISGLRAKPPIGLDTLGTLECEQKLSYFLTQISGLLRDSDELVANPRFIPPCAMLVEECKRSYHRGQPDLCAMLDSTELLDDLAWLIELFDGDNNSSEWLMGKSQDDVTLKAEPQPTDGTQNQPQRFDGSLFGSVPSALYSVLSTLMSDVNTLTLLASQSDPVVRMLKSLLLSNTSPISYASVLNSDSDDDVARVRLVLGLELACKLEVIQYLDVLIDWARRKGTFLAASQILSNVEERRRLEPVLHEALFGIAKLCTSFLNATRFDGYDPETSEAIRSILSASAPTWVAEVIGMDDYFTPFLMLLEAFTFHESSGLPAGTRSISKSKDPGTTDKDVSVHGTSDALPGASTFDFLPTCGLRATLRQMLTNPLDPLSMVTAIVLTVLHHSEDVTYLDRYGSRLAQLVTGHIWEDSVNESAAISALSRLQSFARAGAPYLHWLRECPTRLSAQNLSSLSDTNSLFCDSFTWLVNQLKPLWTELEESLDELLSLETADELVNASSVTSAALQPVTRRQPINQGIVAAHSIPPALLLLLRLIRAHVCDLSHDGNYLTRKPEKQVVLSRSLALIELHSVNGLHKLSALIEKLCDYFLLQCQAIVTQASCPLDLLGISMANANVSVIFGMLHSAVLIVCQLLTTILHVQGTEFHDLTVVRPLCQAYACAVYVVCPTGPKRKTLQRLSKAVIAGLLAYTRTEECAALSVKEIEKSIWLSVCREVIAFTISAPMYYLPGLKILLDLLPLSLPIYSLWPIDEAGKKRIRSARDRWAVHLLGLVPEFTGLMELLGGTDPVPSNPLYTSLLKVLHRVSDLGLSCALFLATSCLDTLFTVWDELFEQLRVKSASSEAANNSSENDAFAKQSQPVLGSGTSESCSTDAMQTSLNLRTAGARLLLHSGLPAEDGVDPMNQEPSIRSEPVTLESSSTRCSTNQFGELDDSTELTSALGLFYINLQVPACRYAILHLLRQSPVRSSTKSFEETSTKTDLSIGSSYASQLLSLIRSILLASTDKSCHIRTQLMLLKSLGLLVHTDLALRKFDEEVQMEQTTTERLQAGLVEGLPESGFLEELVAILLEHISHPDRDMVTLPPALYPLIFLTHHDQGFVLVRNALDSPTARKHGQHFFANMVQRVNDCFSTENPDCQFTLSLCLRLLQSLLIGRTTLPLTFAPDQHAPTTALRCLHISGARVRDWLGWSAGGDEGKPVRDLHALLEMLTDDEPSLEYLRSGMKNLLCLLSEEFDVAECEKLDKDAIIKSKPRSIDDIFASRPYFISLNDSLPVGDSMHRHVLKARRQLGRAETVGLSFVDMTDEITCSNDPSPCVVTCNLADLATNYCSGLSIREELSKCGRQRESGEAAIRHQKRRRGQSSIIETGRSSKKFVAPMRGRGFVLRGSVGQSSGAGSSSSSSLSGGGGGSAASTSGGRLDPFRSRPLNTSRPPSLHVDDFTKLIKTDAIIEDPPRSRPYRDSRGFRGRGQRIQSLRGAASSGLSLTGTLPPNLAFGLCAPSVHPLSTTSLLPGWPLPSRPLPLLPFGLDSRNPLSRRDRLLR